jgi:SAM-dependent methyltransferase
LVFHLSTPHGAQNVLHKAHYDSIVDTFDGEAGTTGWAGRFYRKLLYRAYKRAIPSGSSVLEIGCGSGELLSYFTDCQVAGIDLSPKQIEAAKKRIPNGKFFCMAAEEISLPDRYDFIVISDAVNLFADVQVVFQNLRSISKPSTRLILNFHNTFWRPIIALAKRLGLAVETPAYSWLNRYDLENLLWLANWQVIRNDARVLLPIPIPVIESLFNRWLAPLLPTFCLVYFLVARLPVARRSEGNSVTIVVPARNEAGNIESIVKRLPQFEQPVELIFIEGHSSDNTWEEILRVKAAYPQMNIVAMRQSGKGKGNAVRDAFAAATKDILIILDADQTVPPEDVPRFIEALVSGRCEFANGVRLVYPMEDQSMQFANMCANYAFGVIFAWLLGQRVKDTLCGTKCLYRQDYEVIAANRSYFGDFDPFGDFDLLFGASKLNLHIADIPIRYRQRTYGTTNIQRWRHGVMLLRMVLLAARKLRFVE